MRVSSHRHLLQDRVEGTVGPTVKSSLGVPGDGRQIQQLHGSASVAGAVGYHGGHIDGGGLMALRWVRVRGDRRGQPAALASQI